MIMPDISNEASLEFWKTYPDPMIYKVVVMIEAVENWTLDGNPELENAVVELGKILDDVGNVDFKDENDLIKLATYIKAGRALRLLYALDTAHPGAASKLLMHAETTSEGEDDIPGIFLRRNIIFERLRLLGKVFSKERMAVVTKALEVI